MRFYQVRREFKKTLWGEELDNERYSSPAASSIELDFMHQYDGRKFQCVRCTKEQEENNTIITNQGIYCTECYQGFFCNNQQ